MLEPSKYTKNVEPVPNDLLYVPKICVLGMPKCGKSTLCQQLAESTGAVHIQMEELIESFMDRDAHFADQIRTRTKLEGKELDELTMVNLLIKRL